MQKFLRVAKWLMLIIVVLGLGQTIRGGLRELAKQETELGEAISVMEERLARSTDAQEQEAIRRELEGLRSERVSIWSVRPVWGCLAFLIAMLGTLPAALFWRATLREFGYPTPAIPSLGLYFGGNLGKYVPGKAMVVILRTAGLRKFGVPTSVAILSIFVETLLSMAVAGVLGGMAIVALDGPAWLVRSSMVFVLLAGVPTLPPVFRRAIEFLWRMRSKKSGAEGIPSDWALLSRGLNWSLWLLGWFWLSLGWCLMGVSLWCLMLGGATPARQLELWSIQGFLTATAAATLSVVAGFLSLLPGGAGVREYVITFLLTPMLGRVPALAIAVWMRLVSLASELLWAGGTGGLRAIRMLRGRVH